MSETDRMVWRTEFDPPSVDPRRFGQILQSYQEALAAIDAGEDAEPFLSHLRELTQKELNVEWMLGSAESTSPEVAAELLARPEPPRISSITREELIALVVRLLRPETTETEEDWWMGVLRRNVPHPRVLSIVYSGKKSAEEAVDEALAYRPFLMGSGDGPERVG